MFNRKINEVIGMLLQFRFSNFRCFSEETVFDMTATPIKEHRYSLLQNNGVNILPVAAIYGANASGKSSFFMAMERMRAVVVDRLIAQNSPNDRKLKPFSVPFMFDEKQKKEPTFYEATLLIRDYKYRYGFVCNNDTILSEYLYKQKNSKNTTVEKLIFKKIKENIEVGNINKSMKDEIEYCASMSTNKILLLTEIGLREKCEELRFVFSWFFGIDIVSNITQELMLITRNLENFIGDMLTDETLDLEIKERYKSLIKEIDPSISDIIVTTSVDSDGNTINKAKTQHVFNGKTADVLFATESEGTNKFMFLAIMLLMSIRDGAPIFVDEIDSKLHPLVLRKIVQMFTDKETNPKGAQLIFSAHNIIILDSSDLRRDEIWFVEKENHISTMYSLVDFEDEDGGIRSDLNYGKHYLNGRFGAVPFQD